MTITLSKFGVVLTSRQAGREAFAAFQPTLASLKPDEKIEVDFAGLSTLSPSWADEFLTPLCKLYGGRVLLLPTENPSVKFTMEILKLPDNSN